MVGDTNGAEKYKNISELAWSKEELNQGKLIKTLLMAQKLKQSLGGKLSNFTEKSNKIQELKFVNVEGKGETILPVLT